MKKIRNHTSKDLLRNLVIVIFLFSFVFLYRLVDFGGNIIEFIKKIR